MRLDHPGPQMLLFGRVGTDCSMPADIASGLACWDLCRFNCTCPHVHMCTCAHQSSPSGLEEALTLPTEKVPGSSPPLFAGEDEGTATSRRGTVRPYARPSAGASRDHLTSVSTEFTETRRCVGRRRMSLIVRARRVWSDRPSGSAMSPCAESMVSRPAIQPRTIWFDRSLSVEG